MSITYLIERKTRFSLAEQVVFTFGTENDEQQVKNCPKESISRGYDSSSKDYDSISRDYGSILRYYDSISREYYGILS